MIAATATASALGELEMVFVVGAIVGCRIVLPFVFGWQAVSVKLWEAGLPQHVAGHSSCSVPARKSAAARPAHGRTGDSGSGSQIGEHGEHAAVRAGVGGKAELEEDLLDVGLDGALGDEQPVRDGSI